MLDKLSSLEERYEELSELLSRPETVGDLNKYYKLSKALSDLTDIVNAYREYKRIMADLADAEEMLKEDLDQELQTLAEDEIKQLLNRKSELENLLQMLLLPRDPNDEKNVIIEIRAGTGGEEAALFAAALFRMYCRYAEKQGWKTDIMDVSYSDLNGFKEVIFVIEGRGVYSKLKYESGVHRVQRIPVTESGGRIHTSAATVAVLPEAEEVELEINPNDLRVDLYCSSGPGGQSVNTTQSAVRITHVPSGLVVTCQDEKSQHKNKDKAMRVLRARLLEVVTAEKEAEIADTRRGMVGSGDRSERIRTYNYPQGRVSDHRIGLTLHKLDSVLEGELDEIINGLITQDQTEKLKQVN
ncbi:MAG: peptide chain release factor 1 [Syntrophomonadaceae bacterium]|nr:peptide chain release factor 1 [Syntrophomonadaceae bacterium]